jgi:soluble lytic murein transglycosylase-like protein
MAIASSAGSPRSSTMRLRGLRPLVAAALLSAAIPATADAQIYAWRDADGTLVLSSTARDGATKTYAIPTATTGVRATRPVAPARARRFEPLIAEYAAAHDVRPDLVRAVIQAESAFNPGATSHKGAMGLMQLMPATAAELGVTDAYDPEQNIRGGVTYLRRLLDQYDGNEELALAAYNAGPGAVNRYDGIPPFRETRDYVARIKQNANVQTAPASRLYRRVEVIDGREVVTFSSKPSSGATLVSTRKR